MATFIVTVDIPSDIEPGFFGRMPRGVRLLSREPHEVGARLVIVAPDALDLMGVMVLHLGPKPSDRDIDDFVDAHVREVLTDARRCKLVLVGGRIVGVAATWTEAARVARAAAGGRVSELASEAPNAFHFGEA
jgi:hypothetical protein